MTTCVVCGTGEFHRLRGASAVGDVDRARVPRRTGHSRLTRVQPRVVRVARRQTPDQRSRRRRRLQRGGQLPAVAIGVNPQERVGEGPDRGRPPALFSAFFPSSDFHISAYHAVLLLISNVNRSVSRHDTAKSELSTPPPKKKVGEHNKGRPLYCEK